MQGYLLFLMRYIPGFFRHSWDVCTLFPNNYKFLVCLSICQLAYFLTEFRPIQGYLQYCMTYLSETFWRHSLDVCTLFPNHYNFFVCLSICQLAQSLIKIRPIWGYLLSWMRYISENFQRHSQDVFTPFQNICNFFVCLSAY